MRKNKSISFAVLEANGEFYEWNLAWGLWNYNIYFLFYQKSIRLRSFSIDISVSYIECSVNIQKLNYLRHNTANNNN